MAAPGDDIGADGPPPGDEPPSGHPAIYARNWRTVLAVDAAMGVVVLIAGVVVALTWNLVLGGILGSLGLAYVAAVLRRARRWGSLRRSAGI